MKFLFLFLISLCLVLSPLQAQTTTPVVDIISVQDTTEVLDTTNTSVHQDKDKAETGRIWIESTSGHYGDIVNISVGIESYTEEVDALGWVFTYDPTILEFVECRPQDITPASGAWVMIDCNGTTTPGEITSAAFSTIGDFIPLFTPGYIMEYDFRVVGEQGTTLRFTSIVDDITNFLPRRGNFSYHCLHTGDVNGDGVLSAGDAQTAFLISIGAYTPHPGEICRANCDNSNETITAGDAQGIFRAALGMGYCPLHSESE